MSVLVAGCGSDSDESIDLTGDQVEADTDDAVDADDAVDNVEQDESTTVESDSQESDDDSDDVDVSETLTETDPEAVPDESEAESVDAAEVDESAAALPESSFPNVDVQNIGDGSTVSLASFAGGDKPVLFWFWAPN